MSDIYYNPVRRSAPRSLFQPIQEDEARFYVESHHNPLRLRPPPFPVLFTHPPLARPPSPPKRTPPPSPIGYAPPSPILMRAPGNGAVDAGLSLRSPKVAEPNVEAVAEVTRKRKLEDLGPPEEDQNGFRPSPVDRVREERNTVVVDHYNARPNTDVKSRAESPIIALRSFNNWIKSVLIAKFAAGNSPARRYGEVTADGRRIPRGIKVLDLGCGKGGDLQKWAKAGTDEYIGLDIANVSIEQANGRFRNMSRMRFKAVFGVLDCFQKPISAILPPHELQRPVDVVTMQFCMHYAFETEAKVRIMLDNVSRYLDPGGTFIGTVPNAEKLLGLLDSIPPEAETLEAGNSVYRITFDSREPFEQGQVFGVRYRFFLFDAVDDVPEFVVFWEPFVELAAEYGLELIYKDEFHYLYQTEQDHPEFGQLLRKMKVLDLEGNSQMDAEQWEAANLYVAFAFRKI